MNKKSVPNLLTMLRLVFAALFCTLLSYYQYDVAGSAKALLWLAMGVFIVGMLTDFFDGYLARKWEATSVFGRIMDPFVDKVMVLGALVFLAGPGFESPFLWSNDLIPPQDRFTGQVSGVSPWMVVLMLSRELLVTGIRGEMESRGIAFGANIWGKLKTVSQSVGIPVILVCVAVNPHADGWRWLLWVTWGVACAMTLLTVLSGVPYITQAIKAVKQQSAKQ